MANPSNTRKKPICRQCGGYMAGHKRNHGVITCPNSPESSLISPPPSPERDPTASGSGSSGHQHTARTPQPLRRVTSDHIEFTQLPNGGQIRRNPNWDSESAYEIPNINPPAQVFVGPAGGRSPVKPRNMFRAPSPTSTVSTVLVDDEGHTIYANDDSDISVQDEDWETDSDTSSQGPSPLTSQYRQHHQQQQLQQQRQQRRREPPPTPSPLSRQGSWFSKVAHYAKTNRFSVSILEAESDKEFDQYQRKAKRHGLHIEPINPLNPTFHAIHEEDDLDSDDSPVSGSSSTAASSSNGKKVLVIGTRASFVHQIASTGFDQPNPPPRPRRQTNSLKDPSRSREALMNGMLVQQLPVAQPPSSNIMSHFIFPLIASIVGGCIVLYGMSFIPVATAVPL